MEGEGGTNVLLITISNVKYLLKNIKLLTPLSTSSSQWPPRTHKLTKLDLMLIGSIGKHSERIYDEILAVWGILGANWKNWSLALDKMLSGSKGNSMNKSYLEREKSRVKLKLKLVKKQQSLILCKIGRCLINFVFWMMFIFCLGTGIILEKSWFILIHHGLRVASSDICVLEKCSREEL